MNLDSLHENCPYSELFWSLFSRMQTAYGPEQLQKRTLFTQWVFNPDIDSEPIKLIVLTNLFFNAPHSEFDSKRCTSR